MKESLNLNIQDNYTKNSAKRVDERKTNKDYLKRILSIMSDGNLMQYSNHIKSSSEKDSRSISHKKGEENQHRPTSFPVFSKTGL